MSIQHSVLFALSLLFFTVKTDAQTLEKTSNLAIECTITVDNEAQSGAIEYNVKDGAKPYTITVFSDYSTPISYTKSRHTITDLRFGHYIIVVKDSDNQTVIKEIDLKTK